MESSNVNIFLIVKYVSYKNFGFIFFGKILMVNLKTGHFKVKGLFLLRIPCLNACETFSSGENVPSVTQILCSTSAHSQAQQHLPTVLEE